MKFVLPTYIVTLLTIFVVPFAIAQTPEAGNYYTKGNWGDLEISMSKDGKRKFKIFTVGANAHMCSLAGEIKDGTGYVIEGADDPTQDNILPIEEKDAEEHPCLISFAPVINGLDVTSSGGCGGYCGSRAGFEAIYFKMPAVCQSREKSKDLFLVAYRSKAYSRAFDKLNSMYQQCHEFLTWIEIDSVRNDLAITQYHLGHNEACIAILKDTIGAKQTDEEKLSLPPADFEAYLPVAKATWHNLKLCGKNNNRAVKK